MNGTQHLSQPEQQSTRNGQDASQKRNLTYVTEVAHEALVGSDWVGFKILEILGVVGTALTSKHMKPGKEERRAQTYPLGFR